MLFVDHGAGLQYYNSSLPGKPTGTSQIKE